MKSAAQRLKDKYEEDLDLLQEECHHPESSWAIEQWAIGHGTGKMVRVCSNCWKHLEHDDICGSCGGLGQSPSEWREGGDVEEGAKCEVCNGSGRANG